MMIRTNQTVALTPAQPQPFASSSPKKARLRTTVPPGPSACSVIYPPCKRPRDLPTAAAPALLDRERADHVGVDRADEAVRPGGERRHVVGLGGHAGEDRALEDLRAGRRAL